MAMERLSRPRDPVALAKLIGDVAIGSIEDRVGDGENLARVELGRLIVDCGMIGAVSGSLCTIARPWLIESHLSAARGVRPNVHYQGIRLDLPIVADHLSIGPRAA